MCLLFWFFLPSTKKKHLRLGPDGLQMSSFTIDYSEFQRLVTTMSFRLERGAFWWRRMGFFNVGWNKLRGWAFLGEKIFENCVDSWFCLFLQYWIYNDNIYIYKILVVNYMWVVSLVNSPTVYFLKTWGLFESKSWLFKMKVGKYGMPSSHGLYRSWLGVTGLGKKSNLKWHRLRSSQPLAVLGAPW